MTVAQTSYAALEGLSRQAVSARAAEVLLVVTLACKAGHKDMSLREIKQAYIRQFDKDIDVSTVSARVNELVKAQSLVRLAGSRRPCTLSKASVLPVTVPVVQARLAY